jgi:hypothetical protein
MNRKYRVVLRKVYCMTGEYDMTICHVTMLLHFLVYRVRDFYHSLKAYKRDSRRFFGLYTFYLNKKGLLVFRAKNLLTLLSL